MQSICHRTVNASLAMEDQLVFRSLGLQCLSLTINEVASLCVVVDHELTKLNLLRIASFFGWGELTTNEEIYQQCRVPPPPEILHRVFPQQGHHCPHEYFHREDSTPTDSMGTGGDSGNERRCNTCGCNYKDIDLLIIVAVLLLTILLLVILLILFNV